MKPRFRRLAYALVSTALAVGVGCVDSPVGAAEHWVPLGPTGGIVRLLAQAASDPRRLYAAGDPDGLFRSRYGGLSWQSIELPRSGPQVEHFAIDPSDPDFVLAAAFGSNPDFQIWRSADGGSTWTPAERSPESGATSPTIRDLAFDTTGSRSVYAATSEGIFRSLDRGATWDAWALPNVFAVAIAQDPAAPATWYATGRDHNGQIGEIYRSADGGATWSLAPSAGGPDTFDPPTRIFFEGGALYALWQGALYRSVDGAANWTLAARLQTLYANDFALAASGTIYAATETGVYSSIDGVHWSPPEVASAERAAPADRISQLALLDGGPGSEGVIATGRRGVWRSTDGGSSWRAASRGIAIRSVGNLAVLGNPDGTVLATFEDGLFRIDRDGGTWQRLPRQAGFSNHPYFAPDPHHPGRVYAIGDEVGMSEDQGRSWRTVGHLPHSLITLFRFDPTRPGVLYAGVEIGGGSQANGFAFKSVDGGAHWTEILSFEYLYGLEFDPAHPNIVYRWTGSGLDKSTDGGDHWTPLPDLRGQILDAQPSALLYEPRSGRPGFFGSGRGTGGRRSTPVCP